MSTESYDVFISYSRADGRHAAELDSALRAKGLKPFFDRRNLAPGLPWIRALEQVIGAAKAAIVLMGPRGLGNTQQYERELALVRQTHDPAFPVVPVILPETNTDLPFDFLRVLTWIDFSHVEKITDAPAEIERLLTAIRGGVNADAPARETLCPYRGLDAFREEDSAFFFGRGSAEQHDSPIGQLVRRAREHPFVMVVGRSGSGKSSLIYAGLMPALRRDHDRFWNVLSLRPGASPLRALAAAFNPRGADEGAAEYASKISSEADSLRTGNTDLLAHMIRQELDRAEGKPDRLLLYIDQWEELYTQAPAASDGEQGGRHATDVNRFIDLLLSASRSAPVTVVATVRADFYDPLIAHQEIRSLLPTQQVLLGSMPRAELERTIVEPAKKVGLTFDPPSLVDRILDEAGEDEGMLPLLQYALKETWALRENSTMTADSYARSGGVREAIRITAERTFDGLSADDQQNARRLFLRLVTPGEGQEDTRARAAMPTEPTLRKIVEQFAGPRTRLLVTGLNRAARPTVEVAHEALIRTWPRLRGWIDANREKLRGRASILQAKEEWEQNGRREDLLLPAGFQLERARALRSDHGDLTIDDIEDFIAASSKRERRRQLIKGLELAGAGAAVMLTMALAALWFNYSTWTETRAWARIVHLPTGRGHSLEYHPKKAEHAEHVTANVGRATEGIKNVGVDIRRQRVSRIHAGISKTHSVTDWRSLYGTTINATWLRYGESRKLQAGDILVLAGAELFEYRPIQWRPWHYARPPELADQKPLPGWAALVDGKRRLALPVLADVQFVSLRSDSIELSDNSENAVLVVRRRILRDRAPFAGVSLETVANRNEQQSVRYRAIVLAAGPTGCSVDGEVPVLTLEWLPAAKGRIRPWIKEGDYFSRNLVLPPDRETAFIEDSVNGLHAVGEIIFETEAGPFQIVPTQTADWGEICTSTRR